MRVLLALAFVGALAAASPAATPDTGAPGRLPVGVTTLGFADPIRAGETLAVEIWYPARAAGRDTLPHRGRFPLVLVAHGLCGSRINYEFLTAHLASWGLVVAAPDFPGFTKAACDAHLPPGDVLNDPPATCSLFASSSPRTRHPRSASRASSGADRAASSATRSAGTR